MDSAEDNLPTSTIDVEEIENSMGHPCDSLS